MASITSPSYAPPPSDPLRSFDVHAAGSTEAMTVARRRGSTKFWLSTGGNNETAQALYEALGGDRKPLGDVNYWWDLD